MLRTSNSTFAVVLGAVSLLVTAFSTPADAQRRDGARKGDLQRVSVQTIEPGETRVSIRIGRREGRFDALTLRVLTRPVKLKGVEIVFGNGERQRLRIGEWLDEYQKTEPIELDGRRARFVKRIEIGIRPVPRNRVAKIEVLADADGARDNIIARQRVAAGDERVSLRVSRDGRALSNIAIQAERQSFYLRRAEVTFRNGRTEVYRIRRTLDAGNRTPALSFGDRARRVERVDIFIRPAKRSRFPGELLLIGDEKQRGDRRGGRDDRITREDTRPERGGRTSGALPSGKWVRLGAQKADRFDDDRDVFKVGAARGRYKAIRVKARRHDVMIKSMRVTYGNGQSEVVPIRGRIKDERQSDPFVFNRRGRRIENVTFNYQTTFNLKGSAVVELWALQ